MKQIIVLKGLPGSGKSTWAKEYLNQNRGKIKRVNKDELRAMINGPGGADFETEKIVVSIRDFVIEKLLSDGYDVIVDDTNFKDKHFFGICNAAKRVGDVRVFEKYFECPLNVALERNKNRPNPVPESVIHQMYESNIKNKTMEIRDLYFPKKGVVINNQNPKLKTAIIVDIDGTLAINTGTRSPYDMTRVKEDEPNKPLIDFINDYTLILDHKVLLVSGREDCARKDTEDWLKLHGVFFEALYMRATGDSRADTQLKKEIFDTQIKGKYNILFVIDDRKKVSRMFREELDLMVFQLNDVDF